MNYKSCLHMQSMTLVWFVVFIRISDQNTRYTLVYQSMTCVQINSKYIIQLPLKCTFKL